MTSSIILLVLLGVCYVLGHGNHGHAPPAPGATPPPANTMGFHDTSLTQDEAHIKEHLKDEIDVTKKMTPQELEFHYFRLHDTNNDTKLDGLEIMAALSHIQHMFEIQPQEKQGKTEAEIEKLQAERKAGSLQYFADVIDNVLKDDDFNHDGYISYPEYMSARKRDYIKQQQEMAHHNEVNMQQQAAMQQQQYQQYMQWQQQQHHQQQQIGGNVQQFQQNPQQYNQQQPQQQQQLQYKPNQQQQQQQQQQFNPNQQQQFQQPQQQQQFQQPAASNLKI